MIYPSLISSSPTHIFSPFENRPTHEHDAHSTQPTFLTSTPLFRVRRVQKKRTLRMTCTSRDEWSLIVKNNGHNVAKNDSRFPACVEKIPSPRNTSHFSVSYPTPRVFKTHTYTSNGTALFCLCPAGGTPSAIHPFFFMIPTTQGPPPSFFVTHQWRP